MKSTYGTGLFMLMNTGTQPVASTHRLLSTLGWQIGGQRSYALEGSVFMGGAIVQWLRDGLGIIDHASQVGTAAQCDSSDGVVLAPVFAGLGAPYWDPYARGTLIGMTRGTARAHIARAALEAIALQTVDVLVAMEADAGIAVSELRVDGGASQSDLLMQIQADLLGRPVVRPKVTETTVLGAAHLAGLGARFWTHPDEFTQRADASRFEPVMSDDARAAGKLLKMSDMHVTSPPARVALLRELDQTPLWDVIVIGGGASGLGTAVDAASRGYRPLLVEARDFAKGTSSKATKLVHGGVRYLAQGNVPLARNAPHLVSSLGFIVPAYQFHDKLFYGAGLKIYDWLAGSLNLEASRSLSIAQTRASSPMLANTLDGHALRGSTLYFDGQLDDARLTVSLMRTLFDLGGIVLNNAAVRGVQAVDGKHRLTMEDTETGDTLSLSVRCVVNATGVWVDSRNGRSVRQADRRAQSGCASDLARPFSAQRARHSRAEYQRRPRAVRRAVARSHDRWHDRYAPS